MGVQRVGFYVMAGEASTYYLTSGGGVPIPGSGIGNKSFTREGFVGQFYAGPHIGLTIVTQHGSDNAWFGQGYGGAEASDGDGGNTCGAPPCPPNNVPGTTLPVGSQSPSWNGVTAEGHYIYSPQLIFIAGLRRKYVATGQWVGIRGRVHRAERTHGPHALLNLRQHHDLHHRLPL